MSWEVDYQKGRKLGKNNRVHFWARDTTNIHAHAREWHWVAHNNLNKHGIRVSEAGLPRKSWEVDWSIEPIKIKAHWHRWARNKDSIAIASREWHWVKESVLHREGLPIGSREKSIDEVVLSPKGYVLLTRKRMTADQIALAEILGLFAKDRTVHQHILVAAMKYGSIPRGMVVRHKNGIKTDNRPDNLILGTHAENNMDHQTARREAMIFRERCENLERLLIELLKGRIT